MLKTLLTSLSLLLAITNGVRADECTPIIQAARKAIEAQKQEIQDLKIGLDMATKDIAAAQKDINKKDEQLGAWYRNPFVVGALSLVVGAAAMGYALKN